MFGLGKKPTQSDTLSVQVRAVASGELFKLAQKIWEENARTMRLDERMHKEFLHFAYDDPKCIIWLQRDEGRSDTLEIIVRWENGTFEVCVLTNSDKPVGDTTRPTAILNTLLTKPSVVLSGQ